MKTQIYFLIILIPLTQHLNAQHLLSCNGNEISNVNYNIQFSVGEVIIDMIASPTWAISQGYQQPHYIVTSIDEIDQPEFDIAIYPNPVTDQVSISSKSSYKVLCEIFSENSECLFSQLINTQDQIDFLRSLPSGPYIIVITLNERKKIFKLVKM